MNPIVQTTASDVQISASDPSIDGEYQFYLWVEVVGSTNKYVTNLLTLRYGCGAWLTLVEGPAFTTIASFDVLDVDPANKYTISDLSFSQTYCFITGYQIINSNPGDGVIKYPPDDIVCTSNPCNLI